MAIALLIIGTLLLAGGLFYLVSRLRKFIHDPLVHEFDKKELIRLAVSVFLVSAGSALLMGALFLSHPEWEAKTVYGAGVYEGTAIDYPFQLLISLFGIFFFALSMSVLWGAFAVHFYQPKMKDPQKKVFTSLMFGAIPFAFLFFVMATSGIGPYLTYPLVSGFHLAGGFGWDTTASRGDLHIAWYGLIMLFGVCVSYWVCDHRFYKEFHKHGILDSVVLVAFPAGVVGARIWYVVGNYQREFAGEAWWKVFMISDGGITILGGAFAGVLAGVIFLMARRKYVNLRWAMDVCVPSILLAQAIGRWGNFWNVEVYGKEVALSAGWSWLPNWLALQMNCINQSYSHLAVGMIHVPLFLVEGILSVVGYFVIVYGIGKGLRKYLSKGDLAGFYFLWYGVVRVLLEPLRDEAFNMGTDNSWSVSNSIVYIVLGFAIIMVFHLHDYFLQDHHHDFVNPLVALFLSLPVLFFPFLQSLTATYEYGTSSSIIAYDGFALLFSGQAPLFLAAYVIFALSSFIFALSLVLTLLQKAKISKILLIAGLSSSVSASLLLLLGKASVSLPETLSVNGDSYSLYDTTLSYGFVLSILFGLWAAAVALVKLQADHQREKKEKRALEEGEVPEKVL
jgi:phosphatidylglycerol---prolipoprotein diacylglyceryl transferase